MKTSAGILLYRFPGKVPEVFLVHPGGPFWKNKDLEAWSIPKGEIMPDEDPLEAARREFEEETGFKVNGKFTALTAVKLKSGKTVQAWALEKDINPADLVSNQFELEWPPKSGKIIMVPEADKGEWFTVEKAKQKINAGQKPFIDELITRLAKK